MVIDEDKIPALNNITGATLPALTYVNTTHKHFNLLDKIISFDSDQQAIFDLVPPLVIIGNHGLNALQIALKQALIDECYARQKLAPVYKNLEPDSLSIQAGGQLIKLDKRLMGLFVLNLMFATFYRKLGTLASDNKGFSAQQITQWVQMLPDEVLPPRRKKQSYISSILSGNEVDRDAPYNRRLFKRIQRGQYVINPAMKLRQGDQWVAVSDLLKLEDLGFLPGWLHLNQEERQIFKDRFAYHDQYRSRALQRFCLDVREIQAAAEAVIEEDQPAA